MKAQSWSLFQNCLIKLKSNKMEEIILFKELITQNKFWDAHTVGKNLFCKFPDNQDIFDEYFGFCCTVASYPIETETRSFFLKEAEVALSIFSERAKMSIDILKFIEKKRQVLINTSYAINQKIEEELDKTRSEIIEANNSYLRELVSLKGEFLVCNNQALFDKLISQMATIEEHFDKESFTDTQKVQYDSLTREFSNLVSKSMAAITNTSEIEYNKKAVKSFKAAFDFFKNDSDRYTRNERNLYELVAKHLFAYDAKRLFNETLVYYNHVYTYIFNKLSDEGKFRFTQFSFDVPKV